MDTKDEAQSGLALVLRRLRETIRAADADGGKTYDEMAERIRSHASDGIVREALGYVPEEAENIAACDPFRPVRRIGRKGKESRA